MAKNARSGKTPTTHEQKLSDIKTFCQIGREKKEKEAFYSIYVTRDIKFPPIKNI